MGLSLLGYFCYALPLVYLALMPFAVELFRSATLSLGEVVGSFAPLMILPVFWVTFVFPPIVGPLAVICLSELYVTLKIAFAHVIVGTLFFVGMAAGFSLSHWVILDLWLVGHLLAMGIVIDWLTVASWCLFGFLFLAFTIPALLGVFHVTAGIYMLAASVLLFRHELRTRPEW